MLVLSRRRHESIVFPNIGVTVKLLRVERNKAKLGISAPPDVRILREEVDTGFDLQLPSLVCEGNSPSELHSVRNRLNTVNLAVHLYQQQMASGDFDGANMTFLQLVDDLEAIDQDIRSQEERSKSDAIESLRLLLVEDDARQRELLASYLTNRGCNVATADDCESAVDYLEANACPDYVLLDLRLPGMDGAESVRRIRAAHHSQGADMKIFAVSGTAPEEFGIETGRRGVDDWFPKPTNPEVLFRRMCGQSEPAGSIA